MSRAKIEAFAAGRVSSPDRLAPLVGSEAQCVWSERCIRAPQETISDPYSGHLKHGDESTLLIYALPQAPLHVFHMRFSSHAAPVINILHVARWRTLSWGWSLRRRFAGSTMSVISVLVFPVSTASSQRTYGTNDEKSCSIVQ